MQSALELMTTENLVAFLTLAALEIVLGIDNIVFIAILTSKLPRAKQSKARRLGLGMAMGQRLLLLFAISWIAALTAPLFSILGHSFSGRDLVLLGGGLFLIAKATFEVHGMTAGDHHEMLEAAEGKASLGPILMQITVLDAVFSLDSVITAVGMAQSVAVMVAAVIASVLVMMVFANPISDFIVKHPTVKMLALTFLLLIGVVLVADGTGRHIEKGYIYFAMGFSIMVEALNFRLRGRRPKPRS